MNNVRAVGQSWLFDKAPSLISGAAVVGKKEGEGPLGAYFDVVHEDNWLGMESYEKAEQKILEEACNLALRKGHLHREDIRFHLSGDLLNQTIASNFTAAHLGIPYLGIYGACSTAMEGLGLAAYLIAGGGADYVLASTCSHTNTSEKQFRYPNEYGAQKKATAQCTVLGAGAAVVAASQDFPVAVSAVTVGRVRDFGVTDPFNMGAAMAGAAADTIACHLRDRQLKAEDYDLIVTGDLGRVGSPIAEELLRQRGIVISEGKFKDGGIMIYPEEEAFLAGGSGCGCMAVVTYGYLWRELLAGRLRRVLCVATGALLSKISIQQKQSIPGVAHAVALERR